ncbi:MAG: hypothetical protein ABJC26_13815 [Gemmatimonadaceae bacterium]
MSLPNERDMDSSNSTLRRSFLSRLAKGSLALAATSLFARPAGAMSNENSAADDEPWLKGLAAKKHKQVFDAANANGGFPFMFASAYMGTMAATYKLAPTDVGALVVGRHMGMPVMLNDAMWAKYQIGKMINVIDPATNAPSTRNIFYHSKPGDMMNIAASSDKLMTQGVLLGACNVAMTALSGMAAAAMSMKPEDAYADWKGGLLQGVQLLPSGVLAIGRAQEIGCTYCYGGG